MNKHTFSLGEKEYEAVIGLEVHVQLNTASKIFSSSSAAFGAKPNTNIDPIVFGLPGSLPVTNREVIRSAVKLGLATHCHIRALSRFARKHYFYPDLPKGYQISQYDEPICENGQLQIQLEEEGSRTIGITRIHMEEDAGKTIHLHKKQVSHVDLNRAGVPLLEIVSEPDMRTSEEAGEYLRTLRRLVRWLEISDGNMEEGSLRCDANISLRPIGDLTFGTRTEVKNLNSFKFVEQALEYEIARQLAEIKAGRSIVQQTLLFDTEKGTTRPMRGKEESADYRYFPDPDIPPIEVPESEQAKIRKSMPKLPEEYFVELTDLHGLSAYDANILTSEKEVILFFEQCFHRCHNAKATANWICSELFGVLHKESLPIEQSPVAPEQLATLIRLIDDGTINSKIAKEVFLEVASSGKSPQMIIEEKGLQQITDEDSIRKLVRDALATNEQQKAQLLSGKKKLRGFFVGQVMKASGGKANPQLVNEILDAEIAQCENDESP